MECNILLFVLFVSLQVLLINELIALVLTEDGGKGSPSLYSSSLYSGREVRVFTRRWTFSTYVGAAGSCSAGFSFNFFFLEVVSTRL